MKKTNQLLTFLALALVMTLLAILTYPSKNIIHAHTDAGKAFFPELKAQLNGIEKFTLRDSNTTYTFTKNEKEWRLKEKADFPVKIEPIRQLLIGLSELKKHSPKTSQKEHYEVLHLNALSEEGSQAKEITLYDAQGNVLAKLLLGKEGPSLMKSEGKRNNLHSYYVRIGSEGQSWLAKGLINASLSLDMWLDTKLLDIDKENVNSVTIKHQPPIHIYRDETGQFNLQKMKTFDQGAVNELSNLLSFFYFDDVKHATEENDSVIEAQYDLKDSARLTLRYHQKSDEHWVRFTLNHDQVTDVNSSDRYRTLSKKLDNRMFQVSPYKMNILKRTLQEYQASDEK